MSESEQQIQRKVIEYLRWHRNVAWVERMNVGARKIRDGFIRFGFRGCSDIIGQMKDGRFLAVEVKKPGGIISKDQEEFIATVKQYGGVACIIYGQDELVEYLE